MENKDSIKQIDESIEEVLAIQFDEDVEYTRMRRLSKEFSNKVGGVRDDVGIFSDVYEAIFDENKKEEGSQ